MKYQGAASNAICVEVAQNQLMKLLQNPFALSAREGPEDRSFSLFHPLLRDRAGSLIRP